MPTFLLPTFVHLHHSVHGVRVVLCFPPVFYVSRHGTHTIRRPERVQRGAHLQDLPVPQGHETDAGAQTKGAHQPLPRRTQGTHGDRPPKRGRERLQAGEGGHPRADRAASAQFEAATSAGDYHGAELPGSVPGGIYSVRTGSVSVFVRA